MDEDPSNHAIHAGRAVLIGQLMVNLPVILIMIGAAIIGLFTRVWLLCFIAGFLIAWFWWSFMVPRWRRWSLKKGAPADRLQELAEMTGLVWPKGSFFEKTEFKLKKD